MKAIVIAKKREVVGLFYRPGVDKVHRRRALQCMAVDCRVESDAIGNASAR